MASGTSCAAASADHLADEGAALLAQQGLGQRQQRVEAGVAALVDGVPEAGQPAVLAQDVVQGPRRRRRARPRPGARRPAGWPHRAAARPGWPARPAARRRDRRARTRATRTAMVEVASSWSAMRTRAALTAAAGTRGADRRGRAGPPAEPRSRIGCSPPAVAGGGPTTSVSAAAARRAARATAAGTQVGPQGIRRPAHARAPSACARASASAGRGRGRGPPSPPLLGLPQQLGHLLEAGAHRQLGGRAARGRSGRAPGPAGSPPVVMVASRVAVWRPPRLRAARRLDVGQVEEAPPAATGRGATRAGRG